MYLYFSIMTFSLFFQDIIFCLLDLMYTDFNCEIKSFFFKNESDELKTMMVG